MNGLFYLFTLVTLSIVDMVYGVGETIQGYVHLTFEPCMMFLFGLSVTTIGLSLHNKDVDRVASAAIWAMVALVGIMMSQ